jgi:hypothetical protein
MVNKGTAINFHRHNTVIDWDQHCRQCPFGARYDGPYSTYCLRPDHYRELEAEARAKRDAERDAALQAAIGNVGAEVVDVNGLQYGDYESFRYGPSNRPEGCSKDCACLRKAIDSRDRDGKVFEICTDPKRLKGLRSKESREENRKKREAFAADLAAVGAWLDALTWENAGDEMSLAAWAVIANTSKPARKAVAQRANVPEQMLEARKEFAKLDPLLQLRIAVEMACRAEIERKIEWSHYGTETLDLMKARAKQKTSSPQRHSECCAAASTSQSDTEKGEQKAVADPTPELSGPPAWQEYVTTGSAPVRALANLLRILPDEVDPDVFRIFDGEQHVASADSKVNGGGFATWLKGGRGLGIRRTWPEVRYEVAECILEARGDTTKEPAPDNASQIVDPLISTPGRPVEVLLGGLWLQGMSAGMSLTVPGCVAVIADGDGNTATPHRPEHVRPAVGPGDLVMTEPKPCGECGLMPGECMCTEVAGRAVVQAREEGFDAMIGRRFASRKVPDLIYRVVARQLDGMLCLRAEMDGDVFDLTEKELAERFEEVGDVAAV